MKDLLSAAFDPELFRKEGHQLIDTLSDYLHQSYSRQIEKANPWISPDEMYEKWKEIETGAKMSFKELTKELIDNSVHLHHPRYIGHQLGIALPIAILSDTISSLLNNGMTVFETGPAGTAIERIVIEWINNKIGFGKNSGGVLTSGGSLGNLTGLLAARQKMADYDVWEEGMDSYNGFTIFVSEEAHYCIARAAKILGFGNNVIKVPSRTNQQMDLGALNELYTKALKEGKKPIAAAASACTTSTGSYDNLDQLADFCMEKNLWLHVDGAHGAGVVLTEKYNHLVKGIERADSVVIDFHKMLMCPALATAVLFKDNINSYNSFAQKAAYLWGQSEEHDWFNIGKRSIECSKKIMGFKVFVILKLYGEDLFSEYITGRYDTAKEFALLLGKQEDFETAVEPESNIVCFRYTPGCAEREEYDRINSSIREKLLSDGKFYIVQTIVREKVYLRVTIMNPFTDMNDFTELLTEIRSIYEAK